MIYTLFFAAGYIVGAYLMRRHLLKNIRRESERAVAKANERYERELLARIWTPKEIA